MGMLICREEVFGPVLAVMKFRTDAEAVALANDCPFGLGSTVCSSNKARANTIAHQLQVPMLPVQQTCHSFFVLIRSLHDQLLYVAWPVCYHHVL